MGNDVHLVLIGERHLFNDHTLALIEVVSISRFDLLGNCLTTYEGDAKDGGSNGGNNGFSHDECSLFLCFWVLILLCF